MTETSYRDLNPGDAVRCSLRAGGHRPGVYLGVEDERAGTVVVNVHLTGNRDQRRVVSAFWVTKVKP